MIPGGGNPMLLGAYGSAGYAVAKALRLRGAASAYLHRTPGTETNRRIYTYSEWLHGGFVDNAVLLGADNGTLYTIIQVANKKIRFHHVPDTSGTNHIYDTTSTLNDPSGMYHICAAIDTTQATASDRVKIYVNNVSQAVINPPGSTAMPQNTSTFINSTVQHMIGRFIRGANNQFDGVKSEPILIDGLQLTPDYFGETDAYGKWVPKAFSLGSGGVNSFYLPFSDTTSVSTLGTDFSGRGNNWTPVNVSLTAGATYDSVTDTPTNTFATLSNLVPGSAALTNGYLTSAGAACGPTITPDSGTWYYEKDGVAQTWTLPAAFPGGAGDYNFGQRPFTNSPTAPTLCTNNLSGGAVTTSGTFVGNASADGPVVWLNGVPTALSINGNAVTFGTHALRLAGGFKVISNSASYNAAGTNTFSVTVAGSVFKHARGQTNP